MTERRTAGTAPMKKDALHAATPVSVVCRNHRCVITVGDKYGHLQETVSCFPAEFQCAHGNRCIPRGQVCDGENDCQDRSDEQDCQSLPEGCHHRCDNKFRCIPETFLCDGERDCADGSDEEKCGR